MWRLKKYRGKWAATARINGRTLRRSSGTENREIAERWFDDFINIQKAPQETVEKIFDAYKKTRTPGEQEKLGYMWKNLKPHFAPYRPDQVDRDKCRKYAKSRSDAGISDNTIIRELSCIRSALRWFDKSYPKTFWTPSKPDPKDEFISKEDFRKLLESTKVRHIRLFIVLAIVTAGRTSAILELKWDQIDFERKMINLGKGTKIKRRAQVPMNDLAYNELLSAHEERDSEYVVSYGGRKVASIRNGFKSAIDLAGINKVTPHALRHSAARWMAEAGIPMSEIAQYLGHSDTKTTEKIYARFSPEYLRKAASVLQ